MMCGISFPFRKYSEANRAEQSQILKTTILYGIFGSFLQSFLLILFLPRRILCLTFSKKPPLFASRFSFSNPISVLSRVVQRSSTLRMISVCNFLFLKRSLPLPKNRSPPSRLFLVHDFLSKIRPSISDLVSCRSSDSDIHSADCR
jgi:hypothetical protein